MIKKEKRLFILPQWLALSYAIWKAYKLEIEEAMFAVIYRFKLKAHQETIYHQYWHKIATYFTQKRGAIGSCLHKGNDNLWVAYSRWPDKATRDASWPGDNAPNEELPKDIRDTFKKCKR